MTTPPTAHELRASKGRKKWLQLHVDTPAEAAAAVEAGITLLSCEPDHHLEGIRRSAPSAFLSAGMPHGAVSSPTDAVRLGFDILHRGADADFAAIEVDLHNRRVAAFQAFAADVTGGTFPEAGHEVRMDPAEYEPLSRADLIHGWRGRGSAQRQSRPLGESPAVRRVLPT